MGAYRGMKAFGGRRGSGSFKIQITSMVDMFVILLVFLLKSYSTNPIQVNPSKDLRLPASSSPVEPSKEYLMMVVSKKGIYVADKLVVSMGDIEGGKSKDGNAMMIDQLFEALSKEADKSKAIAEANPSVTFDGTVFMQADQEIPYLILQKIMRTSVQAGFDDLRLAVMSTL